MWRGGRGVGGGGVVLVLLGGTQGCGRSDKAEDLKAAVEDLASSWPGSATRGPTKYVDCGGGAEMPMAYAAFTVDDKPDASDVEASNAWLERITKQYLGVWHDLGWRVD